MNVLAFGEDFASPAASDLFSDVPRKVCSRANLGTRLKLCLRVPVCRGHSAINCCSPPHFNSLLLEINRHRWRGESVLRQARQFCLIAVPELSFASHSSKRSCEASLEAPLYTIWQLSESLCVGSLLVAE